MNNNVTIRRAKAKDLNNILRLNFELFKKEYKEYDKNLNMEWTNRQGKKIFSQAIGDRKCCLIVAEVKESIVGYLCGSLYKKGVMFWKNGKGAELENMFVEKAFRSSGIGTKLIETFLEWCHNQKVNFVELRTNFKNKEARTFYEKTGFKNYDIVLEIRF